MPGTDLGYAATRRSPLVPNAPTGVHSANSLRACYAMSGTDLGYAAIGLRACYAMSGTDLAYATIGLCVCYAMSGTDLAYAAPASTIVSATRGTTAPTRGYRPSRRRSFYLIFVVDGSGCSLLAASCYARPGTNVRYAPTRRSASAARSTPTAQVPLRYAPTRPLRHIRGV
eukprot:1777522-Rhodomonas_salina.1